MSTDPGDGANTTNPGEGEYVAGFSHGNDRNGQDGLSGMAVRPLHLSLTDAQYLTPQLARGVTLLDVYDILQQLHQPPA